MKPFSRDEVRDKYVAFVDILGFSSHVTGDYESALQKFEVLLDLSEVAHQAIQGAQIRVYSDSFVILADTFQRIVAATQAVLMQTLFNDYLVRGGIAFGKHVEALDPPHVLMVSEAVAKAVALEKTIGHPCVVIDPSIEIPEGWWGNGQNIGRGILYFGGHVIVNPCNPVWGQSARTRVQKLRAAHPSHKGKYDWFLELHEAIFSPVPMVPPKYFRDAT